MVWNSPKLSSSTSLRKTSQGSMATVPSITTGKVKQAQQSLPCTQSRDQVMEPAQSLTWNGNSDTASMCWLHGTCQIPPESRDPNMPKRHVLRVLPHPSFVLFTTITVPLLCVLHVTCLAVVLLQNCSSEMLWTTHPGHFCTPCNWRGKENK